MLRGMLNTVNQIINITFDINTVKFHNVLESFT